jgi:hypothetical protein
VDDPVGKRDAGVADEDAGAGDELGDFGLGRPAEGAREIGGFSAGFPARGATGRLDDLVHALVAEAQGLGDLA